MMGKLVVTNQQHWGEEVYSLLSWFDLEKVKNARVMVVGAGALGNEVLKNLALFGIGNIVIVDFDVIEYSNLCRSVLFRKEDASSKRPKVEAAAQRIREINPDVNILTINGDIGPDVGLGIIREMDVVIGCLDSRYARYLINQHCFRANKTWIDGAIENLEGYVRIFSPESNCYECSLTPEELQHITLRTGCPDIAKVNTTFGRVATTPVSSSIIGAIQVQEALKIIHKDKSDEESFRHRSLIGKLFKYDGMFLESRIFKMESFHPGCPSHDLWEPVIQVEKLSASAKIEDALAMIKEATKSNQVVINLRNNAFIKKIIPEKTEKEYNVLLPESKMSEFLQNNSLGINLSERIYQDFVENIGDDFQYKNLTLNQIGIPFYDIIQVSTSRGFSYVELSGDKEILTFN
ncbi:MAG: ThiF family adenylyltransferase [Bacteroidota bacterium]